MINEAEFSKKLVEDLLVNAVSSINDAAKQYSKDFKDVAFLNLLASLVCTMVYNKLVPKGRTEDQIVNDYKIYKPAIENCISSGFTTAFENLGTGVPVDYYCSITVIPEPKNKELPC